MHCCALPLFYVDKPFGYNAGLFDNDEWFGRKRATTYCEKSYNHFFYYTDCIYIFGQFLFKFFGISTNGFRIAAGIIILKIGYDMLQARYTNTKLKDEEIKGYANDISITPLSIPMLCGPGAIANGIIMMDDARTWSLKVTLVSVIALVYILTYIILRLSTKLVRIIGKRVIM